MNRDTAWDVFKGKYPLEAEIIENYKGKPHNYFFMPEYVVFMDFMQKLRNLKVLTE